MCRSIQTLRPPFHDDPSAEEIRAHDNETLLAQTGTAAEAVAGE